MIRARHYDETEDFLTKQQVVRDMAAGVRGVPRSEMSSEDGTPTFDFMMSANLEFDKRGGDDGGHRMHIGAVAAAVLKVLDELD